MEDLSALPKDIFSAATRLTLKLYDMDPIACILQSVRKVTRRRRYPIDSLNGEAEAPRAKCRCGFPLNVLRSYRRCSARQ